jgi:Membrane proteins related to metalloendopeptidases
MKYILLLITLWYPLESERQKQSDSTNWELYIERQTEQFYSTKEYQRMILDELCDYPVIFPVEKPECISSVFGWRKHPVTGVWKFHTGIDIPKAKGTPVYATGNGIVIRRGYDSGYGIFIEIQHASGFSSFYAHLSRTTVNLGDSVHIAEQIACVGNTGLSTGSHLHYEIREGNRFLNPIKWCYCLLEAFNNGLLGENFIYLQ